MATWQLRPTTRHTSKADRVDIHADDGRYVAGYVARADALRMIHSPAEVADEAIGLFLEYRDRHGRDEDDARSAAVLEIAEGCGVDIDALHAEMAAELTQVAVCPDRANHHLYTRCGTCGAVGQIVKDRGIFYRERIDARPLDLGGLDDPEALPFRPPRHARLMAAAPELLEALEAWQTWQDREDWAAETGAQADMIAAAEAGDRFVELRDAAIASAKGGQP